MAMARPPPVSIPEDTFQDSLFKALSSEPDRGDKVHLPQFYFQFISSNQKASKVSRSTWSGFIPKNYLNFFNNHIGVVVDVDVDSDGVVKVRLAVQCCNTDFRAELQGREGQRSTLNFHRHHHHHCHVQ